MMAKRTRRMRNQLPHCYHEGYLEKSRPDHEETSQKLWTCLCGNSLFFFNEKRDNDYIEKLDLTGFISVKNIGSDHLSMPARFSLHLKSGTTNFTASNTESRELWKAFIHSIAQLSIPPFLTLLPGQIHMLNEAVLQEEERLKNLQSPSTGQDISGRAEMPACYYPVSRLEASLLLEREAMRGNMLLRPSRDRASYAITTRQELDKVLYKHYRVTCRPEGGFVIDVNNPVHCDSLHDVITYLVEQTDGVLVPLITEGPYERNFSFIAPDAESGERTVKPLPNPPRALRRDGLTVSSQKLEPNPTEEEMLYMNDDLMQESKPDLPVAPPRHKPEETPKKILMPPTPAPRRASSMTLSVSPAAADLKMTTIPVCQKQLPSAAISELKLKLNLRPKGQE
ncbi:Signal-transducing adaptor protein 2 [Oryzias melastigma]|uniref:Signal-transducing adaptor protein 1-like n=1 Tax=Oryzias melastigma TaxID=30732 RepID=A0A3B3B8W5_ORYME|nr:signal-transducing adaptor protein 1 [Oryzias melastigma]KAF6727934.1 Signal-transducing adaptor protein 2 [Oryzias melastigma]